MLFIYRRFLLNPNLNFLYRLKEVLFTQAFLFNWSPNWFHNHMAARVKSEHLVLFPKSRYRS